MNFPDIICECGHWYKEHGIDEIQVAICAGCDAGGQEIEKIEHHFTYSAEKSTPQAIADRGGDPKLWPQFVKDYFQNTREENL